MGQPTVIWEITHSCNLPCVHCPSAADDERPIGQDLSTYEAYKTIDQIALLKPGRVVICGGDPLERQDLFQIIDYARRRGLKPMVELVATPNLTTETLVRLRDSGAARAIFIVNGPTSSHHDRMMGIRGSFEMTMMAIEWARNAGLPVEINSLLTRRGIADLAPIADLLTGLGIEAWNVHFVVPAGAARKLEILTPDEAERAFEILATIQETKRFRVRAVEAPGYRRYLIQRRRDDVLWSDYSNYLPDEIASCCIDDVVFIARNGAVRPSAFLPVVAGNIRYRPLFAIVRASDLFVAFRDPSNLKGKCGRCEYRYVCGGSRARAWAGTGLLFASDPMCGYQPKEARP